LFVLRPSKTVLTCLRHFGMETSDKGRDIQCELMASHQGDSGVVDRTGSGLGLFTVLDIYVAYQTSPCCCPPQKLECLGTVCPRTFNPVYSTRS
jgi:hypothetical protein